MNVNRIADAVANWRVAQQQVDEEAIKILDALYAAADHLGIVPCQVFLPGGYILKIRGKTDYLLNHLTVNLLWRSGSNVTTFPLWADELARLIRDEGWWEKAITALEQWRKEQY